jgi:cytochrome c553
MHNSQDGASMATYGGFGTPPFFRLLRGNCLGCHGQSNSGTAVVTLGGQKFPQVYHAVSSTQLAGGNFNYAADSQIHNVDFLGNPEDVAAMFPPPGDEHSNTMIASDFTCSGSLGCHGNRTVTDPYNAVTGGHHGNVTVATTGSNPSTVATSYRFLLGVRGFENDDATNPWENYNTIIHNEYWGADAGPEATKTTPGTYGTISGLCAECHGNFHGVADIGGAATSPFKRHPTDIKLLSTGEYASYTTYSVEAPVARASITTINQSANQTVSPGTDIVMCLSCHYAHGSANADILRWDYNLMIAGTTGSGAGTGCFVCHTTKDGS